MMTRSSGKRTPVAVSDRGLERRENPETVLSIPGELSFLFLNDNIVMAFLNFTEASVSSTSNVAPLTQSAEKTPKDIEDAMKQIHEQVENVNREIGKVNRALECVYSRLRGEYLAADDCYSFFNEMSPTELKGQLSFFQNILVDMNHQKSQLGDILVELNRQKSQGMRNRRCLLKYCVLIYFDVVVISWYYSSCYFYEGQSVEMCGWYRHPFHRSFEDAVAISNILSLD